ncbi:hypothetical protein R3P38DRAFT_2785772 [Favolaschia claudopus]|uniref:Uncharacterized protein n=1 Tax=Favolaschia claudopus TaxID=2862362 RepID=A0AAW0ATL8_9AGAR
MMNYQPGCSCFPCGENGIGCNRPRQALVVSLVSPLQILRVTVRTRRRSWPTFVTPGTTISTFIAPALLTTLIPVFLPLPTSMRMFPLADIEGCAVGEILNVKARTIPGQLENPLEVVSPVEIEFSGSANGVARFIIGYDATPGLTIDRVWYRYNV